MYIDNVREYLDQVVHPCAGDPPAIIVAQRERGSLRTSLLAPWH